MKKNIFSFVLWCSVLGVMAQGGPGHRFQMNPREPNAHDPVMALGEDGRYYCFMTGMNVGVISSADMVEWRLEPSALPETPAWAKDTVRGYNGHTWAPDISYHQGLWYLYYSCSTFGKNGSAIGLAVNKTLDPKSPDFRWQDQGMVIASHRGKDNWNAIDPNLIVDDEGQPWLTYGSFWDGIQLVKLSKDDYQTPISQPVTIARRLDRTVTREEMNDSTKFDIEGGNVIEAGDNAIEAPFIFHHDGYYYLFVSFDYCCRGLSSTYKTVYGRSRTVEGPYYDKEGRPMAFGGGTFLYGPDAEHFGVGHCSAYQFGDQCYFVSHAYIKAKNGAANLFVRPLKFDADGWIAMENNAEQSELEIPFADGVKIHGVVSRPRNISSKKGVAIISHGFNGTHHFGKDYFKTLNDLGYLVYSFDFPYGSVNSQSNNNTMKMSIVTEEETLKTIVGYFKTQPDVDPDRIVLIGESQGGLVSALAASDLKEQVSKLVLIYPALCIPDNWNQRYPSVEQIPDTTSMWGVNLGRQFFLELRQMDVYGMIQQYDKPVLIVHGDQDKVVPLSYSEKAQAIYKMADLKVLKNAGHGFNPTERSISNEYVRYFLQAK